MFRLAIEKALNHMINVNEINITRLDNSLVSVYVEDIDLRLFFLFDDFVWTALNTVIQLIIYIADHPSIGCDLYLRMVFLKVAKGKFSRI